MITLFLDILWTPAYKQICIFVNFSVEYIQDVCNLMHMILSAYSSYYVGYFNSYVIAKNKESKLRNVKLLQIANFEDVPGPSSANITPKIVYASAFA